MKTFSEETRRKMSESAKRRCTPEWRKRRSEMMSTPLDEAKVRELYESGMTQAEVAKELGVTQKVIWRFMKNHGIKARVAAKRNQFGPANSSWKGGVTISAGGYIWVRKPDHPRAAANNGYVQQHVLVMEEHIGRYLRWNGVDDPNSEIVHHINGDKTDNRIDNLRLMTIAEHTRLHSLERARRGGAAHEA